MVVGGGNYMEYGNLVSYARKKAGTSKKRIIYGCTDVINPEQFLEQVSLLFVEIHFSIALNHRGAHRLATSENT